MNIFFFLNNLHFALEIFGALSFFIVAWFTLDSYLFRRDFLTASRTFGFFILFIWQAIHAFGPTDAVWNYFGFFAHILGLSSVALSFFLERPAFSSKLHAILILPSIAVTAVYLHSLVAILYATIAFMAFLQYKVEFKKALKPFLTGSISLFFGAFLAIFYPQDFFGPLWILGHLLEAFGFGALITWVWQYLKLRVREEMVLIFTSSALLISIAVTFAFSIILVSQVETAAKASLLTNAKVFNMTLSGLKEEALAKTKFLSRTTPFGELLASRDFTSLEAEATKYMKSERLGFLIIVNENGEVILRAHALTRKEDSLSGEKAVTTALSGNDFVNIESSPAEKFSIRAASPLYVKSKIVGAVVAGFLLDDALVDNIKRITGLEMSIWNGNSVVATTLLSPDGRTRGTGIILTDEIVRSVVLENGEETVVRTEILSHPALASYIPIKNTAGEVVGMISSVKPQKEILALANATNQLTLATVAVLMLILAFPIYLVTRRLVGDEVL